MCLKERRVERDGSDDNTARSTLGARRRKVSGTNPRSVSIGYKQHLSLSSFLNFSL